MHHSMLLVAIRLACAAALVFTEALGLFHTSLALSVGALMTVMADGTDPRETRRGSPIVPALSMGADFAYVATAFALLTLRLHTPYYLPIAVSVSFAVFCLRCFGEKRVRFSPFGRYATHICIAFLIALFAYRVRSQTGYVMLLSYGPAVIAAYLGASAVETIVGAIVVRKKQV
jgi:phosphatidylglycerophosphate synthase